MTSWLATLMLLLADATEPTAAAPPAPDRTIEITIVGPESARGKMEETLRPLIGDAPDVRWTARESLPSDEPPTEERPEGGARIWIDVANPVKLRVYLPGCAPSGGGNVRTVECPQGGELDPVGRETIAQIVKATVQSLRGDAQPPFPLCQASSENEPAPPPAAPPRRPRSPRSHARSAGAVWLGLGAGAGWGYVPEGKPEWEQHLTVVAQTGMAGRFHLLPEVGTMWSDDFALALQVRWEFIKQEQATYQDPSTNRWNLVTNTVVKGTPHTQAAAGIVRAIWYADLSSSGSIRLAYSADLGGGYIRFPVRPSTVPKDQVAIDSDGKPTFNDPSKIIFLTDTRPMGMVLFGGSVGLIWHLSRHFAFAFDARVLSGLPEWGIVCEGQASAQLAFDVGRWLRSEEAP